MVNRRGLRIELPVEARVQPIVPGQQSSIEMPTASLAAYVGHQQRSPATLRRRIIRERHDFGVAHALPASLHMVQRRFVEALDEDDIRVSFNAGIEKVFGPPSRVPPVKSEPCWIT